MGHIYIISDLHLGHTNLAVHRGFKDEFEYHDYLVQQWNSVIAKKDVVWILGDITMEKDKWYFVLDQLNGIKKVVLGNHDQSQHVPKLLKYVNKVCGVFQYRNAWLTHIPIHPQELVGNEVNIHGHIHNREKLIQDSRYKCVTAELVDYKPVLLETLIK